MDGLTTCCVNSFFLPWRFSSRTSTVSHSRRLSFLVLSSKDDDSKSKMDQWDEMELKFGQMIGEDPKLTLAKIMGRKSNPDASYLEIEESFNKKKKKGVEIEEIPFDAKIVRKSSNSLTNSNLVRRPVPQKGVKFEVDDMSKVAEKKTNLSLKKIVDSHNKRSSTLPPPPPPPPRQPLPPPVILRKPTNFNEDDIEMEKTFRMNVKPNLVFNTGKEKVKDDFSDIRLLNKPAQFRTSNSDQEKMSAGDFDGSTASLISSGGAEMGAESRTSKKVDSNSLNITTKGDYALDDKPKIGLQPLEQRDMKLSSEKVEVTQPADTNVLNLTDDLSKQAELQGKPQKLDQSKAQRKGPIKKEMAEANGRLDNGNVEVGHLTADVPMEGREDTDWTRAEYLLKSDEKADVELLSCSTRGFVASFGTLVGFLPYQYLSVKWKFLAFESWLRKKGLDPSMYKQSLSGIGGYEVQRNTIRKVSQNAADETIAGELAQDARLEDLLEIYDQEKTKYLSSFTGQILKANVVLADRNSRKLVFSLRPKEKEELVKKKRNLMAKLSIGDVVKACITKITYFGIFVEVEGVPALIHQSEVSWDATLDPSSFFKIDQIVDAKVQQLDYARDRISLSLKELMTDPLADVLEYVVGDRASLDGGFEPATLDDKWAEVESLITELQKIEGVQSVSKGRFFLSPGLAPTFQVYMASMFETQYKLLARSENKVQEVLVQASLDKEQMKDVIITCTNRVE